MDGGLRSFETSRALIAAAGDVLPGGVGSDYRAGPTALVIDRAEGATVVDADGNRLIDYVCGAGPIILGHDHPAVTEAVIAQVRRGVQTGAESRAEHEAARLAVELIPCAEQVRFTNSGSEAVLLALRLARAATGRTGIVKLHGSYHGWSDPVMVGGPGRAADDPGTAGADPGARAATHVVPTWDLDAIEDRLRTGTIAALLVEPYHRGHRWHPPGFLESLRTLTREHGTLLIFDEVLSGFRVGPGGAQGVLGLTPDLSTFAKAVANGHAVGGVAGPRRIMSLMGGGPVIHPGTYNGNPLGMAAAVATLTELRTGVPYERIHEHGGRLMDGLGAIARTRWPDAEVQGVPASFRLSLGEPATPDAAAHLTAETQALVLALLERGVRIVPGATWYLNAAHDASLIDETLAAFRDAVTSLPEPPPGPWTGPPPRSSASESLMPSRPLRRQLALALAGGTLALVAAVPPVAAATPAADATEPITARVMIGGACIGGDAPDGNVAVTLRRKGAPDLRKTTTASGGSFQVCFKRTVRAGDIVKLVADIKTRQITVPRLDAFADRVKDTLTGHSAAGDLTGTFIDCGTGVCMALPVGPIGIKPDRTFSHPLELSGSDEVLLDLTLATGDVISTSARTATIVAPGRKRTTVQVLVAKSGTVVVTVRNAAGKVRGNATATLRADGRRHTLTIRKNGKAVALRPGDRIGATIAKDAKLTLLPSLKVAVDGTADTFDATCYPDLGYGIEFIGAGASLESGTADGSGKVHPIRTDFTTGDTVRVWCYTPAGDQVLLTGTVS